MAKQKIKGVESTSGSGITLDFEGISTEFEPLPVGTYEASVKDVKYTAESQKSGKPYLTYVFEVEDPAYKGRQLFHNESLQPQSLWRVAKTLKALGVRVPKGEFNLDIDELVGLSCRIAVGMDTYRGEPKNSVEEVLPA